MFWNLPHPFHPRILHRHRRIKPLGDGMADQRCAFFGQFGEQDLFFGNQRIDLGGFVVEKSDNGFVAHPR